MIYILVIYLIFCSSCTTKSALKTDIAALSSKQVQIPLTLYPVETKLAVRGYKMIIYVDSTSCSSCSLNKLYLWEDLIEWSEQYDGALKFYFIFNPPKGENIRLALRNSMLDYPMLLDSLGDFERLNPHLPKNKAMHTFLLDENNNVALVGNPLHNPKIEKMFKEIVEEKLGKKE